MEKDMHKVGIRILSKIQLENILPMYENLLWKIEKCREEAKKENGNGKRKHYQYNYMYDNVFSIMGQRGSGKTSVAFTLQNELDCEKYKEKGDIVLPLIIPEVIPENCTVLGWLLAIVKEEMEKLEEDIYKLETAKGGETFWSECRIKSFTNQETILVKLERLYECLFAGNYNPQSESSYYRVVGNSVLQAQQYYEFTKNIAKLWDEWIERIQYYMKLKGKGDSCPLIYFIFDDVDLAPEKIEEILSVIIKYLSHPNIIVITTADERLFLEVIENKLNKNIGDLPADLSKYLKRNSENVNNGFWFREDEKEDYFSDNDIKAKTARMYLGKVLPPSTRYYLNSFNTAKHKEAFYVEDNINLGIGIKDIVEKLIVRISKEGTNVENFMKTETGIINFYLQFMGNSSRQIGNMYIAINELIHELQREIEGGISVFKVYHKIKYFLRIAINANHNLSSVIENVDEFVDNIFLLDYNQWNLYLNYSFLTDYMHEKLEDMKKRDRVEIALALFSLFAFAENLLVVLENVITEGITKRKKIHVIQPMTEYFRTTVFNNQYVLRDDLDAKEYFLNYGNILDRLGNIISDNRFEQKFNMEYFYDQKNYSYINSLDEYELMKICKMNTRWFKEIIGRIFLVYGNVYLFDKRNMQNCMIYTDDYLNNYQKEINLDIHKNIQNCFLKRKMQDGKGTVNNLLRNGKLISGSSEIIINSISDAVKAKIKSENSKRNNRTFGNGDENNVALTKIFNVFNTEIENRKGVPNEFCINELKGIIQEDRTPDTPEEIKELMIAYIGKINDTENELNTKHYIDRLVYAKNVLMELQQASPIYQTKISDIIGKFSSIIKDTGGKNQKTEIDAELSSEFLDTLASILKWENVSKEIFSEHEELKSKLIRIIQSVDVTVDIDKDDFRKAIEFFMQIKVLEKIHEEYVYGVISERYKQGNNLSSKQLEKYQVNNQLEETYYFQIFKVACDILSNSYTQPKEIRLKKIIKKAYEIKRQIYVNFLMTGVKNE